MILKRTPQRLLLTLFLCIAVLFSSLSFFSLETDAAANGTGSYCITSTNGLRLRAEASTDSTHILTIPYQAVVNVSKLSNNWGYTTYSGQSGWICLDYAAKVGSSGDFASKLAALQQKYPAGKYWSHTAGKTYSMQSYSSTPCSHHAGNCGYSGNCGCNSFFGMAIQCHGFSALLGYEVFGTNPYNAWTKIYSAKDIRVGDIVRYRNNSHTIFITGISGNTLTYGDGNADGKCGIRWNQTVTRSALESSFTYVWRAGNYESVLGQAEPAPKQPTHAAVEIASDDVYEGRAIQFSLSSDGGGATAYTLTIAQADVGTVLEKTVTDSNFSCTLPAGLYSAKVTASNSVGSVDSDYINFAVYATRKDNLGQSFYAMVQNNASELYITNSSDNQVTQEEEKKNVSQILQFQRQGDGTYTVSALRYGNYLTVVEEGFADGTAVCFAPLGNKETQTWRVEKNGEQYYLGAQCAPTLVLEMPDGSKTSGAPFKLKTRSAALSQAFAINTVQPAASLSFTQSSVVVETGKKLDINGFMTVSPQSPYGGLSFTSSDTSTATVNAKGVVTAQKAGTVKITVKAANGQTLSARITVKVQEGVNTYVTMRIGYRKAIQNGIKTTIDTNGSYPFTISGRTMLPLRFVAEKLGGKVKYISDSQPITVSYGNTTVSFLLNSSTMTITTGTTVTTQALEVRAQKRNGRTYIPLRAIGQALGFTVYYQNSDRMIIVSSHKMTKSIQASRLEAGKAYIR